jgi:hypothetical protein
MDTMHRVSAPIAGHVRSALPVALALVALVAAACARPTADGGYPRPTGALASAYPVGWPTRRTSTPWPTVTLTATVSPTAGPDEPVTVCVSLEEAEREVMRWFDPTRQPRIEWSKYMRRDAFIAQFTWDAWLADMWLVPREDRPLDLLRDDPLIVAVASTRAIDAFAGPPVEGWIGPAWPHLSGPHSRPCRVQRGDRRASDRDGAVVPGKGRLDVLSPRRAYCRVLRAGGQTVPDTLADLP